MMGSVLFTDGRLVGYDVTEKLVVSIYPHDGSRWLLQNVAMFPSNCGASHPRTRKSSEVYILFKNYTSRKVLP